MGIENIIKVIEEASPSEGYTDEEIKNNFWNSPPPRKGYGRYLLQGKNRVASSVILPTKFTSLAETGSMSELKGVGPKKMAIAFPGGQ